MKTVIDKLVQYYSKQGSVVLLESQSGKHRTSQFSYLAARPKAWIKAYGRKIEIIERKGQSCRFEDNPWNALTHFYENQNDYLFGYFGYDLKNQIQPLQSANKDKVGSPDLFFMVPSLLLKIDHQKNSIETIKEEIPKRKFSSFDIKESEINELDSSIKRKDYISKIEQIQHDIYEGKYYELNFTHQLSGKFSGSPYGLYRKMRHVGQVPFGAYLAIDDLHICCASPERFLRRKGKKVLSQPIKGTIKRSNDELKDQQLKQCLLKSSKNRAENLMIVDLVRNDLNRIALNGSVKVRKLFDIQSFSTVHQMVSTITAVTNENNPLEIIQACFPMGSMTGAPKISVMQSIDELENYKRGIYSGAIGYMTPTGDFDFNVVIRTAIIKQDRLYYSVGGAITADSDPQEEWEESWLKAEALLKAVESY